MKINRDKVKGFALGVLATAVFAAAGGTAIAASKGELMNIRVVQGGIKLFVDGKLSVPKDAQGKTVEPFIYDGTTYLPLRAVSDVLTNSTKPVKWDSASSSVYIGQAPMAAQTDLAELPIYKQNSNGQMLTGKDAVFNLLDKQVTPFNLIPGIAYKYGGGTLVYVLDSKYKSLDGFLNVQYEDLKQELVGAVTFYNVNKQGVETKIASFNTKSGNEAIAVNVDLRGVEILKIDLSGELKDSNGVSKYNAGVLYNITLNSIK